MERGILCDARRAVGVLAVGIMGLVVPKQAQAQSWQWAIAQQSSGTTNQSSIVGAARDAMGNTVVAGNFTGTITLGNTTLVSAGNQDVFVARVSPGGTWVQAVRGGGSGYDQATSLALDAAGTVTVGGSFLASSTTFGSTTLSNVDASGNTSDLFLARLSPAGAWGLALRVGGTGADQVRALAIDAAGTATVVGTFAANFGGAAATVTFGSTTLTNSSFYTDVFVARLSAAGTWTQAVSVGGAGMDTATGVALDAAGNACVVGHYSSNSITFGSTTLTNATNNSIFYTDLFVARFSAAGQWTQAVSAGGTGLDEATGVALDASGNATVVGNFFSGNIGFGSTTLANTSGSNGNFCDLFVARLGAAGTWTRAISAGGDKNDYAQAVALDRTGAAIVAGYFTSTALVFGSSLLSNASNGTANPGSDLFVAGLGASGSWSLALGAGGTGAEEASAVFTDPAGLITIAGTISSRAVQFGSTTVGTTAVSGVVARLGSLTSAVRPGAARATLVLAPNPTHETSRLSLPEPHKTACAIQIFDALGRLMRQQVMPAHMSATTLAIAGLPAGVYSVHCGGSTARLVVE